MVRAAGLTKPTLSAHFRSKDELVAAALEQRHAQRAAELLSWVNGTADPEQRPLAVFAWLADWYARDGARGCGFLNVAAELPDPGHPARVVIAREKRWLENLLVGLVRDAGLADAERLGRQLLMMVDGVAARVVVHGPEAAPDAVADAAAAADVLLSRAGGS